ncbi:flagellar basal body-associated FliL family protein [Breznakiellaceae bacterium SP9]
MSDNHDMDLGDDEGAPESAGKKSSGLAALLPALLKFVAIGLGAIILIVTVVLITVNIRESNQLSATARPDNSPYLGTRPTYSMFSSVGAVRSKTSDVPPQAVVVEMIIGYKENDPATSTELTARIVELQDFVRQYFSEKKVAEIANETALKKEILERLNRDVLSPSKALAIFFKQLDVMKTED